MPTTYRTSFVEAVEPLAGLVTKFGGHPSWLGAAEQPRSRRTLEPMTFIGQVVIPDELCPTDQFYMAYLFMTGAGHDDRAIETWDPRDGETAVIVQSGSCPPFFSTPYPSVLTRLQARGKEHVEVPCEYLVKEEAAEEPAYVSDEESEDWPYSKRGALRKAWWGNKIGGSPSWLQGEEYPWPRSRLLLQLVDGSYPFRLNLGTGVGYVFVDERCRRGALLWQC